MESSPERQYHISHSFELAGVDDCYRHVSSFLEVHGRKSKHLPPGPQVRHLLIHHNHIARAIDGVIIS